jgi:MraZ protein
VKERPSLIAQDLLLGTFTQTFDEKGRFLVPKRYREVFADGLYVTRGKEKTLVLYPLAEFQTQYAKIYASDDSTGSERLAQRLFFSGDVTSLDKVGRVLINPDLREYAELKELMEVTLIGVGNRLEIWSPSRWREYLGKEYE